MDRISRKINKEIKDLDTIGKLYMYSIFCQPVELFKQFNYILPREPGIPLFSCYYEACFPQPLLVHLVSKSSSSVALCEAVSSSSRLGVNMTNKLLLVSFDQCQVLFFLPAP